ncbi:MAG: MMPL family transporter [Actinomycetia bacterium]|nr:MMPL family transporter [Actinomycetes bacterium]
MAVPLFVVVFVLVPLAVVTRRNRRSRVIGRSTVEGRSHAGHNSAAVGWMVHTAVRWRYLTLALFTGLGAVSLVAATKVESAFKVSDFFSAETDFITGLDRLDHYYGDTIGGPAYIYVEGDLTDPSTIEAMEATIIGLGESDASFARDLDGQLIVLPNAVEVVRATMSIPGAAANASAHTGVAIADEDGDGLPDNSEAVRAVYESGRAIGVVAGDGTVVFTPEQVETFVYLDESAQATKLEVLVTTFTDDAIILDARDVLEEEATRLAGELGPVVKIVSVSGDVIASQDSLAAFTDAMMVSLPIALILTVVIVGLVLRSARYSAVTILPILLVVFGVWGYMWLRGFTINVVTATIAAIAVGVGIDFCTHFSVRFREELTTGFDRMAAVRRAGEGTGSALAVSAFTSIVGFGVMTAAPAPIFASFGELMAVMIALSALVALLVLPCLLVVVTPAKTTIDAGSPGDDVDLHTEPQTSMPIEGPPIVVMVES